MAVFTEEDKDSLHVRAATEAKQISSYLDAKDITAIAKEAGADAVHPGYGFLSENPSLAEECERAGIVFIGPQASTIRTMGDKLESKRVMEGAGVPVVPMWNGDPPASEFPVLVKAVGGGGGKGMRLVESPAGLKDAMASASREASAFCSHGNLFVAHQGTVESGCPSFRKQIGQHVIDGVVRIGRPRPVIALHVERLSFVLQHHLAQRALWRLLGA